MSRYATPVTVVDGTTFTGLYAANGSLNVIESPGTSFVGRYHPCGAMYVTTSPGSIFLGRYAPDGSTYVTDDSTEFSGALYVDVVSGTLFQRIFDFTQGVLDSSITYSRGSQAWCFNSSGNLVVAAVDEPRFSYDRSTLEFEGFLVEPTSTNVCLWNRDLTNAAWTKTNCTAALDQTGLDGISNSASKITSTAANGTCLQAITLASSARMQSAWVKRITGSGNIQMTLDNGTTWTTVTVTGSWTRVVCPTQTLANPTVGFRIVTSGDAIAVDFVQNENNSTAPTSPIYVTTTAVTRATDNVFISAVNSADFINTTKGTWIIDWEADAPEGSTRYLLAVSDGTASNRVIAYISALTHRALITLAGVGSSAITGPVVAANTRYKTALTYDTSGFATTANGGAVASASGAGNIPGTPLNVINIGGQVSTNTAGVGAKFRTITYHPRRFSNSEMQTESTI